MRGRIGDQDLSGRSRGTRCGLWLVKRLYLSLLAFWVDSGVRRAELSSFAHSRSQFRVEFRRIKVSRFVRRLVSTRQSRPSEPGREQRERNCARFFAKENVKLLFRNEQFPRLFGC